VNATVVRMTVYGLLGRRRVLLLLALPGLLVVVAAVVGLLVDDLQTDVTVGVLGALGMGLIVPLLGLIAGTGVIGPEIDDGSIVHLLAKPLPRSSVVVSKLLVAVGTGALLSAVGMLVAGLAMSGGREGVAAGYAVAALTASVAYGALFLMLAVISRYAVMIGLVYALIWEGTVGSFVPGARALSIQQWGTSVGAAVAEQDAIPADLSVGVALTLLVVVTVAATAWAANRLRSLSFTGEE
jgi:ABC-2 type transport system permease protein